MRRNLFLKSSLRQPARTLVLVLLVGLITFAFVSRVVEYLVVNRETDRLSGYYRSIGSLDRGTVNDQQSRQAVDLVSKSQYVAFEDRRRYCSGVLQGIYNADLDGELASFLRSDVLLYGKMISKAHLPREVGRYEEYQFDFEVDTVVVGYPDYVQEGSEVRLGYLPARASPIFLSYVPTTDELLKLYGSFEIGQRYLVRARFDPPAQYYYDNRYPEDPVTIPTIQPLTQGGIWFRRVEPGASVDLTDPSWAGLAEDVAVLEENQHAMSVYGTADMSGMPLVQEGSRFMYLTNGRWLDGDDNREGRRVCVVHNDFAVRRGLSVGDTITLKLRDLGSRSGHSIWTGSSDDSVHRGKVVHPGYIIPREDGNAWQGYETHTEEFEIVGLYGILWPYEAPTTFSIEMYVPESCMPAGYCSHERIDLSLYSFVLESPEHEKAFLAENQQALKELGVEVSLVETGWNNFRAAAIPLKRSLAVNVWIFSAVLVPAMALAAILYLWQRRKDFAILRSIGVPVLQAVRQLVWSMTAIGTTGVVAGGVLSWGYALGKAAKTLASLQGPKAAGLSTDLSLSWLTGLCAVSIAVLVSLTVTEAAIMSRRPVLELLQGTGSRAVRERKQAAGKEADRERPGEVPLTQSGGLRTASGGGITRSVGEAHASGGPGRVLSSRYVLRHIRRSPSKSTLTVAVALGFTLALGWFGWSIERNEAELDELYRVTQVEAEIVKTNPSLITRPWGGGFIPSEKVDGVVKTGFIKDAYVVATARAGTLGPFVGREESVRDYKRTVPQIALVGFNLAERFFAKYEMGDGCEVEYVDGWDGALFSKNWVLSQTGERVPVVLPTTVMRQFQLKLGDGVWLQNSTMTASVNCTVAGQYSRMRSANDSEDPILLPLSALRDFETETLHFRVAKFAIDPAKNRELPEFRAKMREMFAPNEDGVGDVTLIVWDGQMTQAVEPMEKNLQLIKMLHSVTIAVSTLIAVGLSVLMVFQCAKEASIMRVLGVTKRLARSMFCGEQALLCVVGLVLGLGSYAALRGQAAPALTGSTLGCAALYLAGCLIGAWQGARAVTDRPPLELLQVKE